jgi:hypothetical protein
MSIFNTLWSSIPFVHAMFTVGLFVIIRLYTRDTPKPQGTNYTPKSHTKSQTTNDTSKAKTTISKAINKVGEKAKETVEEVKNTVEGLCDLADIDSSAAEKCSTIDTQTYGELFAAAFISGTIIRLGWVHN